MSEDVRRLVGRNVQQLRIKAGLSQAALAERMGVDRAYVTLPQPIEARAAQGDAK
jgi:DNA-binding XRE family transcriptional regulator